MALLKKFRREYAILRMSEADQMRMAVIILILLVVFAIIGFFIGAFSPLSIHAGIGWSELALIIILVFARLSYAACRIYSALTRATRKT